MNKQEIDKMMRKGHEPLWKNILGAIGFALCMISLMFMPELDYKPKYNCELAEISPDFTPRMRAECRWKRFHEENHGNQK